MLALKGVAKSFILHGRGGLHIPVFDGVGFEVNSGEAVILAGPSGCGKSTLMRMVYGNYRCEQGEIWLRHAGQLIDVSGAQAHQWLDVRLWSIGYVSQFMRVVPRVPALTVVAEPLRRQGMDADKAEARASALLERLNMPEALWGLPPATFSGGEQQRVNIARGLIARHSVLLLDEPTASLDAGNRAVVVELILEALADGVAVVGIFHDADIRERIAGRSIDMTKFAANAPPPPHMPPSSTVSA